MFSNIRHQVTLTVDSASQLSRVVGITKLAELLKREGFNIASGVGLETTKAVNEWETSTELDSSGYAPETFVVTFTDPQSPMMRQPGPVQPGMYTSGPLPFPPGSFPQHWGGGFPQGGFPKGQLAMFGAGNRRMDNGVMAWGYPPLQGIGGQAAQQTPAHTYLMNTLHHIYRTQGDAAAEDFGMAQGMPYTALMDQLHAWGMGSGPQGFRPTMNPRTAAEQSSGIDPNLAPGQQRVPDNTDAQDKNASGIDPVTGRAIEPVSPGNIPGYEHNPMAQSEYFKANKPGMPPIFLTSEERFVSSNWPDPMPIGLTKTTLVVSTDNLGNNEPNYDYQIVGLSKANGWLEMKKISLLSHVDEEQGPNNIRVEDLLAICSDHLGSLAACDQADQSQIDANKSIIKALHHLHGLTERLHLQDRADAK